MYYGQTGNCLNQGTFSLAHNGDYFAFGFPDSCAPILLCKCEAGSCEVRIVADFAYGGAAVSVRARISELGFVF